MFTIFAGDVAISPRVFKLRVTRIAALLEPTTTGGTTARFAGFLDGAALGATGAAWFRVRWRQLC